MERIWKEKPNHRQMDCGSNQISDERGLKMEKLTKEQEMEYRELLEYVMKIYSTHDYKPRDWFDISSGWFLDRGHEIDDEETIGVVFDKIMIEKYGRSSSV